MHNKNSKTLNPFQVPMLPKQPSYFLPFDHSKAVFLLFYFVWFCGDRLQSLFDLKGLITKCIYGLSSMVITMMTRDSWTLCWSTACMPTFRLFLCFFLFCFVFVWGEDAATYNFR